MYLLYLIIATVVAVSHDTGIMTPTSYPGSYSAQSKELGYEIVMTLVVNSQLSISS